MFDVQPVDVGRSSFKKQPVAVIEDSVRVFVTWWQKFLVPALPGQRVEGTFLWD